MGALHWETILVDEWDHRDLNYTTGRILHTSNEQNVAKAIIDEDGLGAGPFDTLTKGRGLDMFVGFRNPAIGYQDNKEFANNRTKHAYKLKDMLMQGHIHIKEDKLIDELMTIKYTFDHNQRRILVSKDKMRMDFHPQTWPMH
jgi:predicted TIM-barrel fold metal-dependent hydrolase